MSAANDNWPDTPATRAAIEDLLDRLDLINVRTPLPCEIAFALRGLI